jgi:hypothetical protein
MVGLVCDTTVAGFLTEILDRNAIFGAMVEDSVAEGKMDVLVAHFTTTRRQSTRLAM